MDNSPHRRSLSDVGQTPHAREFGCDSERNEPVLKPADRVQRSPARLRDGAIVPQRAQRCRTPSASGSLTTSSHR